MNRWHEHLKFNFKICWFSGILFNQLWKTLYKKKKFTHMWRKWGTPQNFFFAFIDELEKQIIIKKTVEVGQ